MRALLSTASGGPETLVMGELPEPTAGPGQVVVAVKACSINFPDTLIIRDLYQMKPPRPFAPGGEISGEVDALGEAVTNLKVGDRVLGMIGFGGFATEVVADANRVVKIPDNMPYDEAACFVLTYGTSHHALKDRANIQAGETLLILGAAGGVGVAAIELGKAAGAKVIAAVNKCMRTHNWASYACFDKLEALGLVSRGERGALVVAKREGTRKESFTKQAANRRKATLKE